MTVYLADEQTRPVDVDWLRRLAEYVLADRRVPDAMELSVLCVETDVIAQLNAHHLGQEGPTDVLAFPIEMPGEATPGQPALLGDVVLCPAVAAEQALRDGRSLESEVELLLVHGILHLLGHDHADPKERDRMAGLTDRLLAGFREGEGSTPFPQPPSSTRAAEKGSTSGSARRGAGIPEGEGP